MKVCKLHFKSSIHLGEREEILEKSEIYIHSDTLFSAFCHSYFLLYGEKRLNELLKKFKENTPPFLISSAFPYREEKYYFPVPLNQVSKRKELKKIKFIEKDGFERLIKGESLDEIIEDENLETLPKDEDEKNPWWIVQNPRVALSRLNFHPGENYFFFSEVFYKKNSGLFFLIDYKDENFEKEFISTLNLLSQEGIGGDRTVGKGLFDKPEFRELELQYPESNSIITLSLYSPNGDEISDIKDGFYEIIERSGYIFSPFGRNLRRKSVRMLVEGSVFLSGKKGRIVDVTPEIFKKHPVYRYGFCFPISCELEVKNEV